MSWMRSGTYLSQFLRDFLPALTDRPDMTLDVYRGRKTTKQQQRQQGHLKLGQPQHEQLLQKRHFNDKDVYSFPGIRDNKP